MNYDRETAIDKLSEAIQKSDYNLANVIHDYITSMDSEA